MGWVIQMEEVLQVSWPRAMYGLKGKDQHFQLCLRQRGSQYTSFSTEGDMISVSCFDSSLAATSWISWSFQTAFKGKYSCILSQLTQQIVCHSAPTELCLAAKKSPLAQPFQIPTERNRLNHKDSNWTIPSGQASNLYCISKCYSLTFGKNVSPNHSAMFWKLANSSSCPKCLKLFRTGLLIWFNTSQHRRQKGASVTKHYFPSHFEQHCCEH